MLRLDAGMLEIFGISHSQLLHHAPRAEIAGRGERNDFRQLEALKTVRQRGLRSLRSETSSPPGTRQPLSDFDARREGRLK
jgi:hypothetical protein